MVGTIWKALGLIASGDNSNVSEGLRREGRQGWVWAGAGPRKPGHFGPDSATEFGSGIWVGVLQFLGPACCWPGLVLGRLPQGDWQWLGCPSGRRSGPSSLLRYLMPHTIAHLVGIATCGLLHLHEANRQPCLPDPFQCHVRLASG